MFEARISRQKGEIRKITKYIQIHHKGPITGSIEKFSACENFRKILKVGHFYLGFSPNKKNNEIKHSQRVSLSSFGHRP